MPGRFQVFVPPERTAATHVRWRLLSENGRALAFSASSFPGLDEAVADAAAASTDAQGAIGLLTPPTRQGWGWILTRSSGAVVAVSSRRYARRVECLEAVARFRTLAPTATLPSVAVRFRRTAQDPSIDV